MPPSIAHPPSGWFTEFSGGESLGVAAASVLSGRLGAVFHYHPLALAHAGESVEHVHHLRVAARRSSAALAAFGKILPRKIHDQAHDTLRAIRRSAGLARDWDVFLMGLSSGKREPGGKDGSRRPGRLPKGDKLIEGLALGHRCAAQKELAEACPDFDHSFPKMMEKIAEAVADSTRAKSPVSRLARPVLNEAFANFREAMDTKESENKAFDPDHLHQVRILGKRVRYLMEIFWHCLEKETRLDHYSLVEESQEILGQIHDHYRAQEILRELSGEVARVSGPYQEELAPEMARLAGFHEKQITAKCSAYRKWFHRWKKIKGKLVVD